MKPIQATTNCKLLLWMLGLCLLYVTPLQAATLVWGSGKWGDTWAASTPGGNPTPQSISGTSVSAQSGVMSASAASFSLGLTRDNGTSYQSAIAFGDIVEIIGRITPEPGQLGQLADIFVVAQAGPTFYMRTLDGQYVPWSGSIPELQPFREDVVLTENLRVDIYTGSLLVQGEINVYIGYMAANGILHYTPVPLRITSN